MLRALNTVIFQAFNKAGLNRLMLNLSLLTGGQDRPVAALNAEFISGADERRIQIMPILAEAIWRGN
jgi:hypothetical protein